MSREHVATTLGIRGLLCCLTCVTGLGCTDGGENSENGEATSVDANEAGSDSSDDEGSEGEGEGEGEGEATVDSGGDGDGDGDGDGGGDGDGDGDGETPVISEVELASNTEQHPGGSACIEVACPRGKSLLSGGGAWDADIQLSSARPQADQGYELCGDAQTGGEWTVQAMCGVVATSTMVVSYEELVSLGQAPCIEVACPAGFGVTGGGSQWHAAGTPEAQRSNSGSWGPDVDFVNGFAMCGWSGGDNTWRVEAICVEEAEVQTATTVETHPASGPDTLECITADCPAGRVLAGGGGLWTTQVTPERVGLDEAGEAWSVCAAHDVMVEWWATALCVAGE